MFSSQNSGLLLELLNMSADELMLKYIFPPNTNHATGGIIWEVEGRGSGSKGVAYHTDSPTQVEYCL